MSSTLHLEQHICPVCGSPAQVTLTYVMVGDDPAPRVRIEHVECTNWECLHFPVEPTSRSTPGRPEPACHARPRHVCGSTLMLAQALGPTGR